MHTKSTISYKNNSTICNNFVFKTLGKILPSKCRLKFCVDKKFFTAALNLHRNSTYTNVEMVAEILQNTTNIELFHLEKQNGYLKVRYFDRGCTRKLILRS